MTYDLILRGGRVIDPSQRIDGVMDVAFSGGKVAKVAPKLEGDAKTDIRNVAGKIVTPGLIDLHTHVYWGGTSLGIDAEEFCRTSGVTTAVDTGSAGPGNFAGFRKHVIEPSQVRILAYLHVSHAGIYAFSDRVMVGESEELRLMNPIDAVAVANANRDVIIGIKVRVGRGASGNSGIVPLDIALEVANEAGMPLMCHIDHPPPSYEEVLGRLRPGDVLTHAFRPVPQLAGHAPGHGEAGGAGGAGSAACASTSATARARSPSRRRAPCWPTASSPTRSRRTCTRSASTARPSTRSPRCRSSCAWACRSSM